MSNSIKNSYKTDLVYATILGLTVVITAWCGLQQELWNSLQIIELRDADWMHREHTTSEIRDVQKAMLDVAIFTNYINAKDSGNEQLANYYKGNFSPELNESFEKWIKTDTFSKFNSTSPFTDKSYDITTDETKRMLESANEKSKHVEEMTGIASKYVLFMTIYSGISFLEGIGRVFPSIKIQRIFLIMGAVLLVAITVILFATMPIAPIVFDNLSI